MTIRARYTYCPVTVDPIKLYRVTAMTRDKAKDTDIRRASFERETSEDEHTRSKKTVKDDQRSLMGASVDPNSPTTHINFPPGLEPEDAKDPGRSTPDAPPVDNRTCGKKKS